MIPQQLQQRYADARPFIEELKIRVSNTLAPFCDDNNYPFSGRIKTRESLAEKIETGRYSRFSEIDDLVAFSVIIPTSSHEVDVLNFLQSAFRIVEIRSKSSTEKSPDEFRFDCTRVIAKNANPGRYFWFGIKFNLYLSV